MSDPRQRATRWLDQTYRGRAALRVPEPLHETPEAWLFACTATDAAGAGEGGGHAQRSGGDVHMVSLEEALRIAEEYLQNAYRGEGYTFVMLPELTKEHRAVWAVAFDTQEHLDTGDMTKAPMTRVLLVPKDGSTPWFPPSAWSVSEYEAQLGAPQ